MSDSEQPQPPGGSRGSHRRRPRYTGTHPRRFEQRYKELDPDRYPQMQQHVQAQGRTPAGTHVPILLAEVLDQLDPRPGQFVCDCTLGYGGHAAAFMERIGPPSRAGAHALTGEGPTGRLIGFDVDAEQLQRTADRLAGLSCPLTVYASNFAGIGKPLAAEKLDGYDIIFADLGVSSMQIDDPARGFSYKQDGPLDMRMNPRRRLPTAADLLAELDPRELTEAFDTLADEEDADAIAEAIARQRDRRPIRRTLELAELVMAVKGTSRLQWRRRGPEQAAELHPAAKVFQALRILVNDEFGRLRELLRIAPYCLRPAGRFGLLTFHSGEDRLVQQSFADGLAAGIYEHILPDPIRPSAKERAANPRSSSAKFRWARRPSQGPV